MRRLNRKGQTLVEYVLIISLVTVVAIAAVRIFGGYLKDSITKSSCGLAGQIYKEGNKPGEGECINENIIVQVDGKLKFKKSEKWKKGDGTNVPPPQKWLSDLKKFGDKPFIFSSS